MDAKVLLSVMVIGIAALGIGMGTLAYFSDTETSTGNTFTAGTLNLKVGNADPTTVVISTFTNMKPGDNGNAATWLTRNDGSIAGKLTVAVSAITNDDNACTEPESTDGDTTCGTGDGELGANLNVAIWMDVDESGTWSSGDYYLKSDGTKVVWATGETTLPTAAYATLNSYASKTWTDAQTVSATTDAGNFRVEYDLPSGTGNVIQSDSSAFDITFTLNQA